MSLALPSGTRVEVVREARLRATPGLAIAGATVAIGPYAGPDDHEAHVLETTGSGNWYLSEYDELRFDRQSGLMASLRLHVPEEIVTLDASAWLDAPIIHGSLRMARPAPFDLHPAGSRWMSTDGDFLVCLYETSSAGERSRIRAADRFDFLVADERVVGWLLADPERFLVKSWETPRSEVSDKELAVVLRDYLELVSGPQVQRIEEHDDEMLAQLRRLADRIDTASGAVERRETLREHITELIDYFYG